MWEPRPQATLGASTACNGDNFTLFYQTDLRLTLSPYGCEIFDANLGGDAILNKTIVVFLSEFRQH
jgi:hypothetical protein